MMPETVIAIDGGYFYAGLVVANRLVIDAAPIIKYMVGWDGKRVKEYCEKKGFKIIK